MKHNRWLSIPVRIVALLLIALLSGCGSSNSSTPDFVASDSMPQEGGAALPEEGDTGADGDRLVIRSKILRLEVDSTPEAITEIQELLRLRSGTVTDMQVATDSEDWLYRYDENGYPVGDGTALRGWVTVRVPTAAYEDFVADVMEVGVVKYQSEATSDVTQQHIDLTARLENLRAQEARLREFFDAAVNVTEMLAIEEELGRIRGEIESMDAQVTYLERQAAMATVTIELTEPRALVAPGGDSWGFRDAITNGLRGAAGLLTWLLMAVIASSPLWIGGLVLYFPIRALVRRRRAAAWAPPTAQASPAEAAVPEPPESGTEAPPPAEPSETARPESPASAP